MKCRKIDIHIEVYGIFHETYFGSGATMASLFGNSVIKTSVVSTSAAIEAAFSMALIVTFNLFIRKSVGEIVEFDLIQAVEIIQCYHLLLSID